MKFYKHQRRRGSYRNCYQLDETRYLTRTTRGKKRQSRFCDKSPSSRCSSRLCRSFCMIWVKRRGILSRKLIRQIGWTGRKLRKDSDRVKATRSAIAFNSWITLALLTVRLFSSNRGNRLIISIWGNISLTDTAIYFACCRTEGDDGEIMVLN